MPRPDREQASVAEHVQDAVEARIGITRELPLGKRPMSIEQAIRRDPSRCEHDGS
jgi:hypothetical protein